MNHMPIRLDDDLPQSFPRQADTIMEKTGKSMKGTELISPSRLKTWGLAFFAVFVVGTVGAFVIILQKDLGSKSHAQEVNQVSIPACMDGQDNDEDGFTDYPNDTTCTSTESESEGEYVEAVE